MIVEAITSAFILILITGLGDKILLSTIVFSARYKKRYMLLTAVIPAPSTVKLIGIGPVSF